MGLLDGWGDFIKTPEGQGLLAATFGGLATAKRGQPINSLGKAGLAGIAGYGNALDQQSQTADRAFKLLQQQRQQKAWEKDDKIDALSSKFYTPGMAGTDSPGTQGVDSLLPPEMQTGVSMPPRIGTPAQAPKFDSSGYVNALMGIDPIKGITVQQAMAKDGPVNKIDVKDFSPESVAKFVASGGRDYSFLQPRVKAEIAPNGIAYDPYSTKTGTSFADPNKPFITGANGEIVPNAAYQQFEIGKSRAGAARTDVRIENKTGDGLAAQVGPMMKDSVSAAEGAAKQIDAANRIISAVDSNKLFSGTGANLRLSAAQVADTFGLGGNTTNEKITNTRQTLQGLAQLTLQGRAQMRGQGAITESESKLAERATSGDITMTPAEIKQLANAANRSAKYVQSEHNRKLQVIKNNPAFSGMAPFYDVNPVDSQQDQSPAKTVVKTGVYQGKKVIQYSDGSTAYAN